MSVEIPDAEYAAKTWMKTEPLLAAIAGRAFFAMPGGEPSFPMIIVSQISGYTDNQIPVDHPRLTFDVWDQTKKGAVDLKRALITALQRISGQPIGDTFVYGVSDITSTWQPDNEAKLARYVVDATFDIRSV